jgi:hypothetical protein
LEEAAMSDWTRKLPALADLAVAERAAACHERSFAVRLLPEQGPPVELASGFAEFLDAFDCAFEWLMREDPARTGAASLEILETRGGVAEKVWGFPPEQPVEDQRPVKVFGFDPVSWKPTVAESSGDHRLGATRQAATAADTHATVVAGSSGSTPPTAAAAQMGSPKLVHASEGEGKKKIAPSLAQPSDPLEPETIPLEHEATMIRNSQRASARASTYSGIGAAVRAMWDEPVSRGCLLLAAASLWLSLFLIDPGPLALLLLALPGLWWRRDKRAAIATVEADSGDWL